MVNGDEEFKKRRFEELGIEPLSAHQKEKLEKKRQEYLGKKKDYENQIAGLQEEIDGLKELMNSQLPSIPKAKYIHENCGLKAAFYYARTPAGGLAGDEEVYYCLFCDKEFLSDELKV